MANLSGQMKQPTQAEMQPPVSVNSSALPSIFMPVFSDDDRNKPSDYYQRSPVQRELFDLDPDNDEARQHYFAHFNKPIADFFAKQLARRIKTYGTQYGTQWFKEQQAVQIARFRLVMAQYADILSVIQMPHHQLEWVDDLPINWEQNWTTFEGERDIELEERKARKVAELSALLPSLSQRFTEQKRIFKQENIRPLCYLNKAQIKYLADAICEQINDHADTRAKQLAHLATDHKTAKAVLLTIYQELIAHCHQYHIVAPLEGKANKRRISDENLQSAFLKIADPKFWLRRLTAMANKQREHLAIAVGMVHAMSGGYVSNERLAAYEEQRRANYEFIKNCVIINALNEEEQHDLLDIWLKTNANPKITRIELMTQIRGYEEFAEREGHVGEFITLTAPSKYHAMLKQGGPNPKWNGAAPHHTLSYLNKVWADIRSSLKNQGIKTYGLRVAEPHHDATPHFHFVIWAKPEEMKAVKRTFYRYALAEDGNEPGAKLRRCRFMKLSKAKGSATAYIAKYVSKNIDAHGMHDLFSDETGKKASEASLRAKAWATLWHIRQFQFFGGASISVWRELRKLGSLQQPDELIDTARAVADVGDYASYLDLQGGVFVKRSEQKIRLNYIETEPNGYLETRKKIDGVQNNENGVVVKTRLKTWVIAKKAKMTKMEQALDEARKQREQDEEALEKAGLPALGLVSVTVRDEKIIKVSPQVREQIKQQVIIQKGRVTEYQIDDLLSGKPLRLGTFDGVSMSLRFVNGQLIEEKQRITM